MRAQVLMLALLGLLAVPAQAHQASDAHVRFTVDGSRVEQQVRVALRDLDRDLGLDTDADDQLSWGEVRSRWSDIESVVNAGISLRWEGARCQTVAADPANRAPSLERQRDGTYAVLTTHWACDAPPRGVTIDYRLFAATDSAHRGLLRWRTSRGESDVMALRPAAGPVRLAWGGGVSDGVSEVATALGSTTTAPTSTTASTAAATAASDSATTTRSGINGLFGFIAEGMHHILIGIDHILFLLALLLPMVRSHADESRLRPALVDTVKTITAFTAAHSLTLALAAFDVIDPPSRWIESLIAATVVAAAVSNLVPSWGNAVSRARFSLTFAFGLVHGFGFAGALKDLGLQGGSIVVPLIGFNAGVELGQLLVVALFLPLAWALRSTHFYRVGLVQGGSLMIALLAAVWLAERALNLDLLSLRAVA